MIIGVLAVVACGVGGVVAWYAVAQVAARLPTTATPGEPIGRATATPGEQPTLVPPQATVRPSAAASASPQATASPAPTGAAGTPAVPALDATLALQPQSHDLVASYPDAPQVRINAQLDPAARTIGGTQTITYTNSDNVTLDAIYLRLFANAAYFEQGGTLVEAVQVDGAPADTMLELQDTALRVGLPRRLAPGEQVRIDLRFRTSVPDADTGYGIFGVSENGTFALYHWYPELAAFEQGGWLLNPPVEQGDATNGDVATFWVTLAAPRNAVVVATGTLVDSQEQGETTLHTFVAPLTRAFAVVAGEQLAQVTQRSGDVTVNSYYQPGHTAGGQAALDAAVQSLQLFSQRFGPYPYNELDVVEVDLGGGAAGMEATGLVMIGSDLYPSEASNPLDDVGGLLPGIAGANALAFTTAHEVAHQWWFSMVGSDPYREPWLDESLTNWSSAFYVDETLGEEAGLVARDLFIRIPYQSLPADRPLNLPVDAYSAEEYGAIVYGKGALMYDVLRRELGDETFFAFLQRYAERHRFGRATADSWRQTLNEVAGRDMTPFYEKWVTSATVTEADLPPAGPLSQLLDAGTD